jgi:hypothetical protein
MERETVHFAFLNERSLLSIIWLGLRRKRVLILDSAPLFPLFRNLTTWVSRQLVRFGIAENPDVRLTPDELHHSNAWACSWPDMFSRLEKEMEAIFGFDKIERLLPEAETIAAKHAACAYLDNTLPKVTRLRYFRDRYRDCACTVTGLPTDIHGWYKSYFGDDPDLRVTGTVDPSILLNLFGAFVVFARTVFWALARIRIGPIDRVAVFLGADFFMYDRRYLYMLREITDSPDDVLLIFRGKGMQQAAQKDFRNVRFKQCLRTDGFLKLADLPIILAGNLIGTIKFLRLGYKLPGLLCFEFLKLPYHRVVYRALFQRYSFARIFGRDDYDSQHIIRTDELRRAGGRSIGINHGLPMPGNYIGVWRYLDFDLYYVFGMDIYRRFLKSTWSRRMKVKSVGSFGMNQAQLDRLDKPRPEDIVIFINTMPGYEKIYGWAFDVARHFSDRTVYLKHKRSNNGKLYAGHSFVFGGDVPGNLVESSESSYDLMLLCRYALSTPNSTIAVESIQFGLATFVWEARDHLATSYYRDFPGLCVETAEELIDRIEAIEDGSAPYRRERFKDMTCLTGESIFKVIREDIKRMPPLVESR